MWHSTGAFVDQTDFFLIRLDTSIYTISNTPTHLYIEHNKSFGSILVISKLTYYYSNWPMVKDVEIEIMLKRLVRPSDLQ